MKSIPMLLSLCGVLCLSFAGAIGAETKKIPTGDTPLPECVAQSAVIAYVTLDTNKAPAIRLAVAEIWKGANDARSLGITNGMQFPLRWPERPSSGKWSDTNLFRWPQGGLPMWDAAVLFFPSNYSRSETVRPRSIYGVRAGRISGMTTNEFRTRFGLW